jgi:hypothetical protein
VRTALVWFGLTVSVSPIAMADEAIRMPTWSEPPKESSPSNAGAGTGSSAAAPSGGKDQSTKSKDEGKDDFGQLTNATSGIFGFAHSRAALFGYSASGASVDRAGDYSALGGSIEYKTGSFSGKDTAKVYFGYELRGAVGYQQGAEYKVKTPNDADPEGSITALGEIGPTLVPIHWGGSVAGRIVLAPAVGLNYNGARYYESYVYLALAGRAQVFLSDSLMLSAQYGYVPWTAKQAYTVREHHMEAALHIADYGFGVRYQIDTIANAAGTKDASSPTLGGFAGMLF